MSQPDNQANQVAALTSMPLLDGAAVQLQIRVNKRAQRIGLRWSARDETFVLVLPSEDYREEGLQFAAERQRWMRKVLEQQPQRRQICADAALPFGGHLLTIRHRPDLKAGVIREADELWVSGRPEHLQRRVVDWLKGEARRQIRPQVQTFAQAVERPVKRISIRDTQTRWGSCSSEQRLNFSWRLVLAPADVMTYVVAHEVSHLREMNHGPRFWRWVAHLMPEYQAPRRWLREHGASLQRIG